MTDSVWTIGAEWIVGLALEEGAEAEVAVVVVGVLTEKRPTNAATPGN